MFKYVLVQCVLYLSVKGFKEINFPKDRCEGLEELRNQIDCKFNPDDYLDVPQIIKRHGYRSESHICVTDDGYLLTLHRIPGKNGKQGDQPVLLQHGLLGSSADWILNGNNSLAFLLADQGYDVWLGNARGNTYSRGHISLPIWSAQYWNFSWHEMGVLDLPTELYYISNTTGKLGDIIYIGHSMGTTEFFVLSSLLPQVAKNVKLMIALAPAAYTTHMRSPIRYLAPFVNDFKWLADHLGLNELLPNYKFYKFLAYACERNHSKKICENILFVLCGFDKEEFNIQQLPTILSHDPAGASTKTVLHYAQEIKNQGNFQEYDYGTAGNMIEYGTPTPPQYKLSNIKRPIYLMYAENDFFASPIDVERLARKLTNLVATYKVPLNVFNHIDFIFGKDAYNLVYKPILKVMRNFTDI
ncbi:lipase 3-like [Anoplophora glabripennis]|uniref:lipase 3-like n=1 Tax=Anoplophora glabripennis TaxID=217634 RepID=UPI000874B6CA|nr:lipase 3-like [Anoplophora glabripennis]